MIINLYESPGLISPISSFFYMLTSWIWLHLLLCIPLICTYFLFEPIENLHNKADAVSIRSFDFIFSSKLHGFDTLNLVLRPSSILKPDYKFISAYPSSHVKSPPDLYNGVIMGSLSESSNIVGYASILLEKDKIVANF